MITLTDNQKTSPKESSPFFSSTDCHPRVYGGPCWLSERTCYFLLISTFLPVRHLTPYRPRIRRDCLFPLSGHLSLLPDCETVDRLDPHLYRGEWSSTGNSHWVGETSKTKKEICLLRLLRRVAQQSSHSSWHGPSIIHEVTQPWDGKNNFVYCGKWSVPR